MASSRLSKLFLSGGIAAVLCCALFVDVTVVRELRGATAVLITEDEASLPGSSAAIPPTETMKQKPLFQSIAPLFFPIDKETGKIRLPPKVTTLAIDIGARNSDYLKTLEDSNDETVALIMFDPLPHSFLPLQERATQYARRKSGFKSLDPNHQDRVFAIHAAVGEAEGTAIFNLASGPSCGSLLKASVNVAQRQACAEATGEKTVMVFTLKDVLDMIPDDGSLKSIHIKIDAEGADLNVLKGAGSAIRRASSVIIECQNLDKGDERILRAGSCLYQEAASYMCQEHHFCQANFVLAGAKNRMGNVFFTPQDNVIVPDYYQSETIQFHKFYTSLAAKQPPASAS